ncbi:MAG: hypothetical protein RLZZ186_987 [Cyanobacteriota bacterium]
MTSADAHQSDSPPGRGALRAWLAVFWLASLLLLLIQNGALPLRDWDESLVARVALETSERPWPQNLLPTLWHQAYLNKPPLLHGLIAAVIAIWRSLTPGASAITAPPEWVVRLVPAVLSSLVVPLVALVQQRLKPTDRLSTLATAAVALTLLPLMRHGRLAMLDGTLIAAMALQWWALLSLSRQPDTRALRQWGLVAGLACSAILLLKAPAAIPLLVGACALLAWEQRWPSLVWKKLGFWMGVGLLPGLLWHTWHGLVRGEAAMTMWGGQGMARVVGAVEGHSGGIWVPVTEVLEGGGPWLALWPLALLLAWKTRRSRWGFWVLGFTLLTAGLVLPLQTQLPWYSHLLWPSFCLAVGPLFAGLIRGGLSSAPALSRCLRWIPAFWMVCGVAVVLLESKLPLPTSIERPVALALGLGGALLMAPSLRWRRCGGAVLVVLLWWSLLALFCSPLWLWELNEQWAVPPVAAMVKRLPLDEQRLPLVVEGLNRPSLEWYLGRELVSGKVSHRLRHLPGKAALVVSEDPPVLPGWTCLDRGGTTHAPALYLCRRESS